MEDKHKVTLAIVLSIIMWAFGWSTGISYKQGTKTATTTIVLVDREDKIFEHSRLDLGLAWQRNVYDYDTVVYLKDKVLVPCTEKSEEICKFSCAPEGLCVFIPGKIVKDHKF